MSDDAPWDDFKAPAVERGPWDDYKPKPTFNPDDPGLLETFARGAAHGATFGYEDKLGLSKERDAESAKANPWTHFAGEMAGGFAPVAAANLLAPEVVVPGELAAAAPWLKTAYTAARSPLVAGEIGTLGQAIGQGAKLGVSYGALAGSGNANVNPEDTTSQALNKRLSGALTGAGEGLLYGPAAGLVGHGVFRGAQGVGAAKAAAQAETEGQGAGALTYATRKLGEDRITPDQLISQITSEFPDATQAAGASGAPLSRRFWGGLQNKQPITSDQVEQTVRMAMQGSTAGDISKALSPGGKGTGPGPDAVQSLLDELAARHLGPLNLVDRAALVRRGSGDNTQMAMRAAAATPGEHVGIARENLLERQVGAGGRLGDLFGRVIGDPDFDAVAAKHDADLKDAGQRAYATAFANEKSFDLNPTFEKWQREYQNQRGPVPDTIRKALDSMSTTQPVVDSEGQLATGTGLINKAPPMDLQGFINARQNVKQLIDESKPGTPVFNKLSTLYKEMTNEVSRTNPDWGTANQIWRDGSAGNEALEAGAAMSTKVNSASRANLKYFTDAQADADKASKDLLTANKALKQFAPNASTNPADQARLQAGVTTAQARLDAANSRKELFKVGLVRALNDQNIENSGETYNLTRQMLLPGAQKMFRTVLGDQQGEQFINGLRAEAAMHRTFGSQFGSQTTPLREAIEDLNWAPKFDASMMNPLNWPYKVLDLAHQYAAKTISAKRNKDLMNIYTETDLLKLLDTLRAMQSVHVAGSNAGNLFGKPIVSGAAPAVGEALSEQGRLNRPQAMEPYQP